MKEITILEDVRLEGTGLILEKGDVISIKEESVLTEDTEIKDEEAILNEATKEQQIKTLNMFEKGLKDLIVRTVRNKDILKWQKPLREVQNEVTVERDKLLGKE